MSDNFDSGYSRVIWNTFGDTGSGSIQEAGGNLETTIISPGGWKSVGLVTKSAIGFNPGADVYAGVVKNTARYAILQVATVAVTSSGDPYTLNEWVRIVRGAGSTWDAQYKTAGASPVTVASAGMGALPMSFGITFPSSGNQVRYIINGAEVASLATYPLTSRNLYIHLFGNSDTSAENDFSYSTWVEVGASSGRIMGGLVGAGGLVGFGGGLVR